MYHLTPPSSSSFINHHPIITLDLTFISTPAPSTEQPDLPKLVARAAPIAMSLTLSPFVILPRVRLSPFLLSSFSKIVATNLP